MTKNELICRLFNVRHKLTAYFLVGKTPVALDIPAGKEESFSDLYQAASDLLELSYGVIGVVEDSTDEEDDIPIIGMIAFITDGIDWIPVSRDILRDKMSKLIIQVDGIIPTNVIYPSIDSL